MYDHEHKVFEGGFIYTYSGRKIYANPPSENEREGPSLEDIAIHTGRMPRFVGATNKWWSVLHHLFVCDRIAITTTARGSFTDEEFWQLRLGCLLHDAHECITGDLPGPFKPKIIAEFQNDLDDRIFKEFGLEKPSIIIKERIKYIDNQALHAEGYILGPPYDDWAEPQSQKVEKAVKDVIRRYPSPLDTVESKGRAVTDYQKLINALIKDLRR